jgi:uncharacterized protein YqjF (DUF2071 family)
MSAGTVATPALFEQRYQHLLLVHWPVPEAALRAGLPIGVEPVPFEGAFWVGHDVYLGTHSRSLGFPAPSALDVRPIVTLRTIVDVEGVRGIFLLSLDAPNPIAAWAERGFLGLRSHSAEVEIGDRPGGGLEVKARRASGDAALRASYLPVGPGSAPAAGSRESFLIGGDRLYTGDSQQLFAIDVVHGPWSLSPATATIEVDTIASGRGLSPPARAAELVAVYQRTQTARVVALPRPL